MGDRFDDAVAVVTGGGAHTERALGIGEATCKLFAEEGATVVVADVDRAMAERTVDAIGDVPGEAVPVELDVADEASVEALAATCEERFGSVDALVNAAGIRVPATPVTESDAADFDRIYEVNLRGVALATKHLLPLLAREDGGAVVNVASANATLARSAWSLYDATKAGVLALTRDVACEVADDGVRVNAVSPGWTVTDYHLQDADDPEERIETDTGRRPDGPGILKRNAHPREQAEAICWLASDRASYVTGVNLPVDGGLTAAGYDRR